MNRISALSFTHRVSETGSCKCEMVLADVQKCADRHVVMKVDSLEYGTKSDRCGGVIDIGIQARCFLGRLCATRAYRQRQ